MQTPQKALVTIFAAASLVVSGTTRALPDQFQDGNAAKFDALAADLEFNMAGRSVGYGYAVYHNEGFVRGGGGGVRRVAAVNRSSLPFDAYTRKGCHSMSKAITAAAMIRALQLRGVSIDSPIFPHLPAKLQSQVTDADVATITFRQILSHRSGIPEGGWRWSDLLQGAATVNPTIGAYDYANWNYAVCRTLIPYVLNPAQLRALEKSWFMDINAYCASIYASFVQTQILLPAGVPNASWTSPDNIDDVNFAYYYNFNNPGIEEVMPNRLTTIGSGGWAMSANGYARFMARLQSGSLLPGAVLTSNGPQPILEVMRASELGMFDSFGKRFYDHSGANTYTNGQNQSFGGRSQWVHDTDTNITVCVQVNSSGCFDNGELYAIITSAIRNAFDSTTTTSTPIPPEDTSRHLGILSAQIRPVPLPEQPGSVRPVEPSISSRSGAITLRFQSAPEAVHIIEVLEDGLWVPAAALPGTGSTLDYRPETRGGTALFRVNTLPAASSPPAPAR